MLLCGSPLPDAAVAYDLLTAERLTGAWSGVRSSLDARGLSGELVYTADVMANVRGGERRRTNYLDNIDLTLTCRLLELTGWDVGTVFLYGLANYGGDPSAAVGDVQGTDNIEAPDRTQLYEAWWQKVILGDRLSGLVGLYDINSEFDVINSAALFLNGSFGTGPELSQSGRNGASVFPVTALAARVRGEPIPQLFVQGAVVDGVPDAGSAEDVFDLGGGQGAFLIGEAAYYWGREAEVEDVPLTRVQRRRVGRGWGDQPYALKVAAGLWGYTARLPSADSGATRHGHPGVYVLAEFDASAIDPLDARGLAAFVRLGWADAHVQQISGYTGGGLVYTGLIPRRPEDRTGLGVAVAHFSRPFRLAADSESTTAVELALEWTYRLRITPWLTLQPDVQWVRHPGGSSDRANAVVLALRTEIIF